mmetsp:Transcript_9732/g.28779  ORF Transcript_9732/g.28779 Transcript_9732/m.28779 type:complete len:320 (-) Transcript_9732:317-1276(-)
MAPHEAAEGSTGRGADRSRRVADGRSLQRAQCPGWVGLGGVPRLLRTTAVGHAADEDEGRLAHVSRGVARQQGQQERPRHQLLRRAAADPACGDSEGAESAGPEAGPGRPQLKESGARHPRPHGRGEGAQLQAPRPQQAQRGLADDSGLADAVLARADPEVLPHLRQKAAVLPDIIACAAVLIGPEQGSPLTELEAPTEEGLRGMQRRSRRVRASCRSIVRRALVASDQQHVALGPHVAQAPRRLPKLLGQLAGGGAPQAGVAGVRPQALVPRRCCSRSRSCRSCCRSCSRRRAALRALPAPPPPRGALAALRRCAGSA